MLAQSKCGPDDQFRPFGLHLADVLLAQLLVALVELGDLLGAEVLLGRLFHVRNLLDHVEQFGGVATFNPLGRGDQCGQSVTQGARGLQLGLNVAR
jgi:hypothetical protein